MIGAIVMQEARNIYDIALKASGRKTKKERELAAKVGIPQRHISEMENGKRPIGKEMAKRFAEIFEVDYRSLHNCINLHPKTKKHLPTFSQ
jgi:plasmid maintenance system antidote protein VapI